MTAVLICKTSEGEYKSFQCSGHAGYARRGQPDILCAAVSVLVTNTINSLEELGGERLLYETNEETGYIRCEFVGELQERSVFLLDSMVFGLTTLSRTYGEKYLQVKFKEV